MIIQYIRSTIFMIGVALITVIYAIPSLFTFMLSFENRYRFITFWSRMVLSWLEIACGLRYEIMGQENIPTDTAIVLCKHQSMWETMVLQLILPRQSWVMKKELLNIPFFGWALRLLDPIAIDRKERKSAFEQLIAKGKAKLDEGLWIVIFPEGTRTAPGQRVR